MTAPDLLLLHGALGAAAQLEPLRAALAAAGRRVHTLDFEGHGTTAGRDRPFRIDHFVENVVAHLDAHALATVDVFGYSMGGYVALALAAGRAHAPRVRRVATLATKLAWTPEVAAREGAMLDAETIRRKVPKFADALAARHTGAGWEHVLVSTRDLLHALGEHPVVTPATLASIAPPVRIMVGDRDTTVTVDECVEAMRALPAGELEVLPATPHPLEKVAVARLVWSLAEFFG